MTLLKLFRARWTYFMMRFARPHFCRVKDLISRQHDGQVHAIRAERLGIGAIRDTAIAVRTELPS